jgi:hypothetical protein
MNELVLLPSTYVETRTALHAVAAYVVAPARKTHTGHIGLRPVGLGIGTPPFDDGTAIVIEGERLRHVPSNDEVPLTTLRAAATFVDIELSADPGVGTDLPRYAPDEVLRVDPVASLALGTWFAFGARVIDRLQRESSPGCFSQSQLWPEHFDLGTTAEPKELRINVGFSPGDDFSDDPYLYIGPHDTSVLNDPFWNAPFGAALPYASLLSSTNPRQTALEFVRAGFRLLAGR